MTKKVCRTNQEWHNAMDVFRVYLERLKIEAQDGYVLHIVQ